jgi:hypothetical protein
MKRKQFLEEKDLVALAQRFREEAGKTRAQARSSICKRNNRLLPLPHRLREDAMGDVLLLLMFLRR